VENVTSLGWDSSVAIGVDGLPVILHFGRGTGSVNVAHCDDTACSSATKTTLQDSTVEGSWPGGIVIGSDSLPILTYQVLTTISPFNLEFRVVHCEDVACTTSTMVVLSQIQASVNARLTIGANGLPIISYGSTLIGLKLVNCLDVACTTSTDTIMDFPPFFTNHSLGIDANGNPIAAMWDFDNRNLRVTICQDPACFSRGFFTVDSVGEVGIGSSLAIGIDGRPVIAYYDTTNTSLKVAHCDNSSCSLWTTITVEQVGGEIQPSIAIGANGLPIVAYYKSDTEQLKLAYCAVSTCEYSSLVAIADGLPVSLALDLNIGSDDLPIVSYKTRTGIIGLHVIHCSSAMCGKIYPRR